MKLNRIRLSAVAAGVLVALRMRRPIVTLQQGLLKVAQGDLDASVSVQSVMFRTIPPAARASWSGACPAGPVPAG